MSIATSILARYHKFSRIKREEGARSALTVAISYALSHPRRAILLEPGMYQRRDRVDMDERWELMAQHIDPARHRNALDIGCHQGGITRRASELGLLSFGIDQGEIKLAEAERLTARDLPCNFFRFRVTPDNVDRLPAFDVIFLLTVYYHWGRVFGWEPAEAMLQTVAANAGELFLQTPADLQHLHSERLPADEAPVDAIRSYLAAVLPDRSVSHLGTTDYAGGDRSDAIYRIE